MRYKVILNRQAQKDLALLKRVGLAEKAVSLAKSMQDNPYAPPCEKLGGTLSGAYSRRLNIKHRMVYWVDEEKREVRIVRMWTHYE